MLNTKYHTMSKTAYLFIEFLNSLPHDKILDASKLMVFTNYKNKLNVPTRIGLVFHMLENNVEKGKLAGQMHFLLSHNPYCTSQILTLPKEKPFKNIVALRLGGFIRQGRGFNNLRDISIMTAFANDNLSVLIQRFL